MSRLVDGIERAELRAVKLLPVSLTRRQVVAGFDGATAAIAADAELRDAVGDFWTELENERARRR